MFSVVNQSLSDSHFCLLHTDMGNLIQTLIHPWIRLPMSVITIVVVIYSHITSQVAQCRQNIFQLHSATCYVGNEDR